MTVRDPRLRVFDADNHLYESSADVFERLPSRFRNDLQLVQVRGRWRVAVKGKITQYIPNPTFDKVAAPGAHADHYRGSNTERKTLREMGGEPIDCLPAFREPGPRLKLLDELGVDRALMYPTIANLIEYLASSDPDLTHAAVHAVNDWLFERWTFDHQDRIFTTPLITLAIVEEAVRELEWALERGARAVLVRPAPAVGMRGSRSIALPEFDPVWARIEEAGVPVCMHSSIPPLIKYCEEWEPSTSARKPSPLKLLLLQHREVEDALGAMVVHGALTRFPRLKVLSVENGADWVPHLLRQLEMVYRRMPQEFAEHPVEVFRRNIYVNPFWGNNVAELVDVMGSTHVLFGSDYPHPEGMREPLEYRDYLDKTDLDENVKRKIMSDNGNALLGGAAASPTQGPVSSAL
jgi:predicted TIM-barrel fold metal-dependent hydrolase